MRCRSTDREAGNQNTHILRSGEEWNTEHTLRIQKLYQLPVDNRKTIGRIRIER